MHINKLNNMPVEEHGTEEKVWPPSPTAEMPYASSKQNKNTISGVVALAFSLPTLLYNWIDLFHSLGYDERIFGRPLKFHVEGYSMLMTIVYFAGFIFGCLGWQSWCGKLAILFSVLALVLGLLFPTFI